MTGIRDGSMEQYNGALDAMKQILRKEGIRGMYRGLWPNLREYLSLLPFFRIYRFEFING